MKRQIFRCLVLLLSMPSLMLSSSELDSDLDRGDMSENRERPYSVRLNYQSEYIPNKLKVTQYESVHDVTNVAARIEKITVSNFSKPSYTHVVKINRVDSEYSGEYDFKNRKARSKGFEIGRVRAYNGASFGADLQAHIEFTETGLEESVSGLLLPCRILRNPKLEIEVCVGSIQGEPVMVRYETTVSGMLVRTTLVAYQENVSFPESHFLLPSERTPVPILSPRGGF